MFIIEKAIKGKAATAFAVCVLAVCAVSSPQAFAAKEVTMEKTWNSTTVEHKGFRDLGHYVIELPDYTDAAVEKKGLAVFNALADRGEIPKFGCTAMAKRNSHGEVILGRNMDLDISQSVAYVFKTTYGKYRDACVSNRNEE
ncbi:MAG: hypothetical protein K6F95_10220 [Selenomonas sp.]|uniref:hypothetical protein n=1 Tax=Selenomonas sp. TaxID=2053611 RepID=UPI0025F1E494|nr:hypothetical protein [Selenomonas sp.]MCR5758264.1 hypothetical protein [Selenomonas sp.]